MIQYFPKLFRGFGENIKNISYFDTSYFTLKTSLANLKTEVNKLDIEKIVPVPVNLSKLSNVMKNDVVEKTLHDKLVTKKLNIMQTRKS